MDVLATASADANKDRRFSVTNVKKNEPPETNARWYFIVWFVLK